jgi:hypothetical protein
MGLKIVRGQERAPVKAVIYGTEGIGKTTLASTAPKPLILDTEGGSKRIPCDRVHVKTLLELEGALMSLGRDPEGYESIVIDSADWAEKFVVEQLLRKHKKESIEDFGYGKGYVMVLESFDKLLTACDYLIERGLNVIWVAHAKIVRTSPPDENDGYDRYELKLCKQVAPRLKEWADLLLFCNYRVALVEGEDGRTKAKGGKERIMHAQRAAAWDAKNRFGLPESLPMSIDPLRGVFGEPSAPEVVEATAVEKPLPIRMAEYIEQATTVKVLGKVGDKIDAYESDGQLSSAQADDLRRLIGERHQAIEPAEVPDAVA